MLKKMNLPNKLTILRMVLVPIFIIFMALPTELNWPLYVALSLFIIAAITDQLDGYIARKNNLITKFGKIMDPLADKLLVSAGLIMLTGYQVIPAWIVAVIIVRDFFVNGLRMFGADKEKDLAAGISGKIKTAFELIAIPLSILGLALNEKYCAFGSFFEGADYMSVIVLFINILMTVSIAVVLLATVWSFIDYLFRFKDDLVEEDDAKNKEEVKEDAEVKEKEDNVEDLKKEEKIESEKIKKENKSNSKKKIEN